MLKVTVPKVSLSLAVYDAVQVFPLVFVYVTEVSVMAASPDLNITTGGLIASLAVSVRVTTSQTFATVVMALFETMLTLLSVGAVVSMPADTLVEFDVAVTAVPEFPALSAKAILKVTAPDVSLALTVYAAVQVFPLAFAYVTEVSVIASPPDRNVTT